VAYNEDLILDLLVNAGTITEEQAEETRTYCHEKDKDVVFALEAQGLTTEEDILTTIAQEYGWDTFDLSNYKIPDDVIKAISPEIAKRYLVIPILKHEHTLVVAIADPTNIETVDTLRYIIKSDIEPVICKRGLIMKAIRNYYSSSEEAVESIINEATAGGLEIAEGKNADMEVETDDAPIIRLVSLILVEAYRSRASDIHLEPMEKRFRIRFRIDGVLVEQENPPKYLQNNIISRLKIMSRMDITEKRVPQDGRIMFPMPGKRIDLRVSTVPTVHGESIVMRILDKSSVQLGIPELGFFQDDQKMIEQILALPDGIFLVTGPTGSGKTTSLYAFLNTLNTPNRKIITAEDPVEYELSGINQVQCDNAIGMTFSRALRAMLRQAPNIVMVGEIRDIETGAIAINAALTGHLVFSTLHTNDAPTAVTRLLDMGVKPFLVASAVRAVMAQRLVRRNCKHCKAPTEVTDDELISLEMKRDYFKDAKLVRGVGCSQCKAGYRGRMGIYEIFIVDDSIVQLIFKSAPSNEIMARARELGMRTLRDDGLRKALAGMTTVNEVILSTKANDDEEISH
jgi:type IV pilus assembly protein PilB